MLCYVAKPKVAVTDHCTAQKPHERWQVGITTTCYSPPPTEDRELHEKQNARVELLSAVKVLISVAHLRELNAPARPAQSLKARPKANECAGVEKDVVLLPVLSVQLLAMLLQPYDATSTQTKLKLTN